LVDEPDSRIRPSSHPTLLALSVNWVVVSPRPTERVRSCERSTIRVMFDLAEASDRLERALAGA